MGNLTNVRLLPVSEAAAQPRERPIPIQPGALINLRKIYISCTFRELHHAQ